jgi:hypothetical protein
MLRPLLVIGAAIGGLAFWRRDHLKGDAEKVAAVAKDATAAATSRVAAARSGRKGLLAELGEAVYTGRTDPDADTTADIDRLVGELEELDAAQDDAAQGDAAQDDAAQDAGDDDGQQDTEDSTEQ